MPILGEGNRKLLVGIGIGVGVAAFARVLAPAFKGTGRPLAKAALRSGMTLYDKGRERFERMRETYEDLMAELLSEREEAQSLAEPAEDSSIGAPWKAGGMR